jgi:large subunit ribosomal protein L43
MEDVARANPHVEVVVRQRAYQEPIVRGFYGQRFSLLAGLVFTCYLVNGRDKVISLLGFEVTAIQKKVQLLLDSSGAKIKPLKTPVVSTTEATRGIWSGLHADRPVL